MISSATVSFKWEGGVNLTLCYWLATDWSKKVGWIDNAKHVCENHRHSRDSAHRRASNHNLRHAAFRMRQLVGHMCDAVETVDCGHTRQQAEEKYYTLRVPAGIVDKVRKYVRCWLLWMRSNKQGDENEDSSAVDNKEETSSEVGVEFEERNVHQ